MTGPGSMVQRRLLRRIGSVRAEIVNSRSPQRTSLAPRRAGGVDDLLLAPLTDEALRSHLARTIRCVRQRSLTDFLF